MADGHRHLLSAKGAMLSQPGPTGRVWAAESIVRPEGARYSRRERTLHVLPVASLRSPPRLRRRPCPLGAQYPQSALQAGCGMIG